jgi:predicted flavoprotein YhiN
LFFAGEILDVDGRIGGFNFQWAWSSAVAVSGGIKKIFNAGRKSGEDVS